MMTRIAIRKKIICLLATYLHQTPKLLSRPQEVEEIKDKEEEEISSNVPINTIVMPIRITFDNPIDFNDHFSKPKDFKKDLTVKLDSTKSSILPPPLLDSDSPFTAELSTSVTLNSLGNEEKVFKPGILVYHAIHDKNLVTLEEKLKENISSGTLLVFKEPSFLLPPPEPPDECLKNVVLNFYQTKKTFPLNVEDVNSFTFIIWTFLPHFTYTEESPLIFSFRSENFVFDPGIITFHIPVEEVTKVEICLLHLVGGVSDVVAFYKTEVRIYLKSQESSKKRANKDTGIRRVQKEAKESKPKPEISSLTEAKAWYLNDGTIIEDTLVVGKVLELIMKDDPRCGLHLNVDKAEFFFAKGRPEKQACNSEVEMKRVAKTIVLFDAVAKINDPECDFLLLRACTSILKLYFAMRTCPACVHKSTQRSFDVPLCCTLERIVWC
ncbi:hypothetical protein Tco_0161685 [Tanacetum coccineum]